MSRQDPILILVGNWSECFSKDGIEVTLKCPGCGQLQGLGDHELMADGTVTPSVQCYYDCGFHDYVRLEPKT